MMRDGLYFKVKKYMIENEMLNFQKTENNAVLAGVSGGADSMAMLEMLCRLQKETGFTLAAVHVNHGIRGAQANSDQKMVEEICRQWEIPCQVYCYDVPKLSLEWKIGHEETGRQVRKEAFSSEIVKYEKNGFQVKIALAHNQNDLAETMLHHLARGTGLRGLCGIRPCSEQIIRPVLCLKRAEIENYVMERNIPYAQDSTNLEDEYTRNRIRHHILPLMEEKVNEQVLSHMAETSVIITEAEEFLQKQGKCLLESCVNKDDRVYLDAAFFHAEKIVQKYAVLEALKKMSGKQKDFQAVHVQNILSLNQGQTGKVIELPYGLTAEKKYDNVILSKTSDTISKERNEKEEVIISVPGITKYGGRIIQTNIFAYNNEKIFEKKYTKWFDYDKISCDLFLRTRKTGDFMVINQEGDRKKITRCMIDEKIPREMRETVLLISCENEILWIPGWRMSEKYKITSKTKNILEITFKGEIRDE